MRLAPVVLLAACSGAPARRGPSPPPPPPPPPDRSGPLIDGPELSLAPREHRLATSHTYSCSIENDGQLYCWGARGVGQEMLPRALGPAGTYVVAGKEPYGALCMIGSDQVASCDGLRVPSAIDLGVGSRFSCALDAHGRVQCAGAVEGTPPRGGVTQLAVGPTHACALLADGGVYCWGQNFLGPVGVGADKPNAQPPSSGRVPIDHIAGIAAGNVVSCAWKTDGTAWCWGDTAFNALGSLGSWSNHKAHPEPVQVPGLRDVTSISVGSNGNACAIDRAGALWCWGHDYQGLLGADVQGDSGPVRVAISEPVAEVSIAGTHACLRTQAGTVWCWGANEWGQLGDAERGSSWRPRQVAMKPAAAPIVAATAPVITTPPSGMRRVEIALTSAESLRAAGWRRLPGGQSTFAGGVLHMEANGFEEWSQGEGDFVHNAGNGPAWAVEAKLQLDAPCAKLGTGFWIHDGFHYLTVRINDHEVSTNGVRADIGSTATPRVLRVAYDRGSIALIVDGKVVGTTTATEQGATQTLMFGVLGDGCGRDRVTWHYIAYETFPQPQRSWPPRNEWHPGTTSELIANALPPAARGAAKGIDAACLAIEILDAGVRDLLPLGYTGVHAPDAAQMFTRHEPLTTQRSRSDAAADLEHLITEERDPICDPAPGAPCGPPRAQHTREPLPPIVGHIAAALRAAQIWAEHPLDAERSTREVADAYAEAIASKLAGATEAQNRLVNRIKALAKNPRCAAPTAPNSTNKRATP